jgi:hypothetical protein
MTRGRDNAAERLGDILELIRMRKQSGVLSLERFLNNHFEEGEIFFQSGQPTYAQTGQLTGQDALAYLLGWRQVYFTFQNGVPRPPTSTSAPTPIPTKERVAVSISTSKASAIPASPRPSPVNTAGAIPAISGNLPQVNTDVVANNVGINTTMYRPTNLNPNTPGLEWLVPQKLGKERDVLSLPLTRPQRSIYLLIDGRRSVADLARCTRKSMQEIERLLIELQERGLIAV